MYVYVRYVHVSVCVYVCLHEEREGGWGDGDTQEGGVSLEKDRGVQLYLM